MLSINIVLNQIIIFELSFPGKLSANWPFLKSNFRIFWSPIFRHYVAAKSNIKRWSEIFFFSFLEFLRRKKNRTKEFQISWNVQLCQSLQPNPSWPLYSFGILKAWRLLCTTTNYTDEIEYAFSTYALCTIRNIIEEEPIHGDQS